MLQCSKFVQHASQCPHITARSANMFERCVCEVSPLVIVWSVLTYLGGQVIRGSNTGTSEFHCAEYATKQIKYYLMSP